MSRTVLLRLTALVIALLAIAAVVVVAYHFGVNNATGTPVGRIMPMRGRMFGSGGFGVDPGMGLFGLIALVGVGLLFFWLLAALLSPNRGGTSTVVPATGDLERLSQLSAMHDAGKLTDDEFTAAKRKLLGLQ